MTESGRGVKTRKTGSEHRTPKNDVLVTIGKPKFYKTLGDASWTGKPERGGTRKNRPEKKWSSPKKRKIAVGTNKKIMKGGRKEGFVVIQKKVRKWLSRHVRK